MRSLAKMDLEKRPSVVCFWVFSISQIGRILADGVDSEAIDFSSIISEISQNIYVFDASGIDSITLSGSFPGRISQETAKAFGAERLLPIVAGKNGMASIMPVFFSPGFTVVFVTRGLFL